MPMPSKTAMSVATPETVFCPPHTLGILTSHRVSQAPAKRRVATSPLAFRKFLVRRAINQHGPDSVGTQTSRA